MIFYILLCVAIISSSKINLENRFIRESPPYDMRDHPGDCDLDGCKICTLNIANGYGFADAQNCTIIAQNIRVTTHWKEWSPIRFRCMKGYVLEGKRKYICINGNWTSQDGINRSSDPDPPSCILRSGSEYPLPIISFYINCLIVLLMELVRLAL